MEKRMAVFFFACCCLHSVYLFQNNANRLEKKWKQKMQRKKKGHKQEGKKESSHSRDVPSCFSFFCFFFFLVHQNPKKWTFSPLFCFFLWCPQPSCFLMFNFKQSSTKRMERDKKRELQTWFMWLHRFFRISTVNYSYPFYTSFIIFHSFKKFFSPKFNIYI